MTLTDIEIDALYGAQGLVADGGETHPILWELEIRGLVRAVYSYDPSNYLFETEDGQVVQDFSQPVYVYTRTELGEELNERYNPSGRLVVE